MRLHLGTAQFGSHYGVSNRNGQPSLTEVGEILEVARRCGVEVIDTAASYGGGEAAIGRALPAGRGFRIVTKLAPLAEPECTPAQTRKVRDRFGRLLANLGQETIYGLLAHRAEDLLVPGGARLVDAMREIAARGQVRKIGVSIYSGEQIDRVLELFTPDIVQLPLNAFDQRLLASGHLHRLAAHGVEILARSVFLQGLLLEPEHAPAYFSPWHEHLRRYARFVRARGLSRLQAALAFAHGVAEIDVVLVGVNRAAELEEIVAAFAALRSDGAGCLEFAEFAVTDEAPVDPSRWAA